MGDLLDRLRRIATRDEYLFGFKQGGSARLSARVRGS